MKEKQKFFVPVLFLIYLALLVWIILFKLQFNINDLDTVRSINLIPFYYDKEIGTAFHLKEVLENLLIFVPMGIYLQMLLPKCRFHGKLIIIAGTSLLLEGAQYVLAIGRSDITDLITNFMGGLLGLALSAKKSDRNIQIIFENHGKTIPPEQLDSIFEKFSRLDEARLSDTGGAGLGLSISEEIIHLHGGTITASSKNETISFMIMLPISA